MKITIPQVNVSQYENMERVYAKPISKWIILLSSLPLYVLETLVK